MKVIEDKIATYVLTHFSKDTPSFPRDVAKATKSALASVCIVLKDMVDEDVLARRRNGTTWEYFLLSPLDIEEYILDKEAGRIQSKRLGALGTNYYKLKEKYRELEKAAKQHEISVECECGRRVKVKLAAEVIEDDTS